MDYKEKYEKALENARAQIEACGDNEGRKTMIRAIFPELSESEDERIRKELMEFIKKQEGQTLPADKYNSWIAYLEKQKERERIVQEREATNIELELHEIIAQARSDKRLSDEDLLEQFEREATLALTWAAEKQFRRDGKLKEQKPVPALDRGDEIILKAICEELKDSPGLVERIEGWYRLAKDAQQPAEWLVELGFEQNGYDPVQVLKTIKEKCPMAWEKVLHQEWNEEDDEVRANRIYLKGYNDAVRNLKSAEWSEEKEYVRTIKSLVADAIRLAECAKVKKSSHKNVLALNNNVAFYQRLIDWVEGRHIDRPAEWSEEDETYLADALWCVEQAEKSCKDENDKGACWSARRWLKALKNRGNFPKSNTNSPSEWSEEDKQMLLTIVNAFRNGTVSTICQEKWLKDLPNRMSPQSQWKPSEEQIVMLCNVRNYIVEKTESEYWTKMLNKLIDDLKKL